MNTQKEKSDGIDMESDDESENSYEVLFGKFYYDLNSTIFKKITEAGTLLGVSECFHNYL